MNNVFTLAGKIIVDSAGAIRAINKAVGEAKNASNTMADKLNKVGKGMSIGVTTPIVAAGTALMAFGNQSQSVLNTFQTELGATASEAELLKSQALEVFGNNFGDNLKDAADGLVLVKQTMRGIADEDLPAVTENAFRLKDVFGAELPASLDAANALMEQFGLTQQEAFDFMATGFQNGLNAQGDFIESITEYSVQFGAAGATAEQFFAIMESGQAEGILGTDKVADSFKEFRLKFTEATSDQKQALLDLGINYEKLYESISNGSLTVTDAYGLVTERLKNVASEQDKLRIGTDLLGTQFEDLGAAADNITTVTDALKDSAGAAEALDQKYATIGDAIRGAWREILVAIEPVAIELVSSIQDMIPLFQSIVTVVAEVIGSFANLPAPIQRVTFVIAAIAAAIGPVLLAVSKFIGIWGTLSTALAGVGGVAGVASAALGGIGAVMGVLLSPITLVVAALGGLAYVLVNDIGGARAKAVAAFKAIKTALSWLLDAAAKVVTGYVSAMSKMVSFNWKMARAISAALKTLVTGVLQMHVAIYRIVQQGIAKIAQLIGTGMARVMTAIRTARNHIVQSFQGMVAGSAAMAKNILQNVKALASQALNFFTKLRTMSLQQFIALAKNSIAIIGNMGKSLLGGIRKMTVKALQFAGHLAVNWIKLWLTLPQKTGAIGANIVVGLINGVRRMAGRAVNAIRTLGQNMLSSFMGAFGKGGGQKEIAAVGMEAVGAMADGVAMAAPAAEFAMEELGVGMQDALSEGLGDIDDSAFATGEGIMEGVAGGIADNSGAVQSEIENTMSGVLDGLEQDISLDADLFNTDGLQDSLDELEGKAKKSSKGTKDAIGDIFSKLDDDMTKADLTIDTFGDSLQGNKDKVKALGKAMENLKVQGIDENSEKFQGLLSQYKEAEAAVESLEAASKKSAKSTKTAFEKTYDTLGDKLSDANNEINMFGNSLEGNKSKAKALKGAINDLISQGYDPQSDAVQDLMSQYNEAESEVAKLEESTEKAGGASKKAAKATGELAKNQKTASQMAGVLGDKLAVNKARLGEVEAAMKKLLDQNVDPQSASVQKLAKEWRALKAEIKELEQSLAASKVFAELDKSFQKTNTMAALLGDTFDADGEKASSLKSAIDKLVDQGLDENSAAVQELAAQYKTLQAQIDESKRLENIDKAFEELAESQSKSAATAALFGDEVDVTKERVGQLKNTIGKLIDEGVDPNSASVQQLAAEYRQLQAEIEATEKQSAIAKVYEDLATESASAAAAATLLGDESSNVSSRANQLKSAIQKLTKEGVAPNDAGIQQLAAEYRHLKQVMEEDEHVEKVSKIFEDLQKNSEMAAAKFKLTGDEFDSTKNRASEVERAMDALLKEGLEPQAPELQKLSKEYKNLKAEMKSVEQVEVFEKVQKEIAALNATPINKFDKARERILELGDNSEISAVQVAGLLEQLEKAEDVGQQAEFDKIADQIKAINAEPLTQFEKMADNIQKMGDESKISATQVGILLDQLKTAEQVNRATENTKKLNKALDEFNGLTKEAPSKVQKQIAAWQKLGKETPELKKDLDELTEKLVAWNEEAEAQARNEQFVKYLDKVNSTVEKAPSKFDNMRAEVAKLGDDSKISAEQVEQLMKSIKQAEAVDNLNQLTKGFDDFSAKIFALNNTSKDTFGKMRDDVEKWGTTVANSSETVAELLASIDKAEAIKEQREKVELLSKEHEKFQSIVTETANKHEHLDKSYQNNIKNAEQYIEHLKEQMKAYPQAREELEGLVADTQSYVIQQTKLGESQHSIKSAFQDSGKYASIFAGALKDLSPLAAEITGTIGKAASNIGNEIQKIGIENFKAADAFGAIGKAAQSSSNIAIKAMGGLLNSVSQFAQGNVIGGIVGAVSSVVGAIGSLFSRGRKKRKERERQRQAILQEERNFRAKIKDIYSKYDKLKGNFGFVEMFTNFKDAAKSSGATLSETSKRLDNFKNATSSAFDTIQNLADDLDISLKIKVGDEGELFNYDAFADISPFLAEQGKVIEERILFIRDAMSRGLDATPAQQELDELLAVYRGFGENMQQSLDFLGGMFKEGASTMIQQGISANSEGFEELGADLQKKFNDYYIGKITDMIVQAQLMQSKLAVKMADIEIQIQKALETGDWSAVQGNIINVGKEMQETFRSTGNFIKNVTGALYMDVAQKEEEYSVDSGKRAKNRYEYERLIGKITNEQHLVNLQTKLAAEEEYTDRWLELQKEIKSIQDKIADGRGQEIATPVEAADNDDLERSLEERLKLEKEYAEKQKKIATNRYDWELEQGIISREEHIANLKLELDELEKFSDEWMAKKREILDAERGIEEERLKLAKNRYEYERSVGIVSDSQHFDNLRMQLKDYEEYSDEWMATKKELLDREKKLEKNRYDWQRKTGKVSDREHLSHLRTRLGNFAKYSDEWMALQSEIASTEEAISNELETKREKAVEKLKAHQEALGSALGDALKTGVDNGDWGSATDSFMDKMDEYLLEPLRNAIQKMVVMQSEIPKIMARIQPAIANALKTGDYGELRGMYANLRKQAAEAMARAGDIYSQAKAAITEETYVIPNPAQVMSNISSTAQLIPSATSTQGVKSITSTAQNISSDGILKLDTGSISELNDTLKGMNGLQSVHIDRPVFNFEKGTDYDSIMQRLSDETRAKKKGL